MRNLWRQITGNVGKVTAAVWLIIVAGVLVRSSLLHQDATTIVTALSTPITLLLPIYAAWRDVKKNQATTIDAKNAAVNTQQQTNGVLNSKLLMIRSDIGDLTTAFTAHLKSHHDTELTSPTADDTLKDVPQADKWS